VTAELRLRVTPNAARDAVGGAWRGPEGEARLVVKVTAPPEGGRANAAVLKLLSKALGAPTSALALTYGEKGRNKTVAVADPPADLEARISRLLEK